MQIKEAKKLELKLYGIQQDVMNDFINTDKHLFNVLAVGSGKSILNQFMALHQAINFPGSSILILTPTIEMGRSIYMENPAWNIKDYVKQHYGNNVTVNLNQKTITFNNGSIISIKSFSDFKKLRGLTIDLAILDELAIQNDAELIVGEIFARIRPKIGQENAKIGRIVVTSSPHGRNGFYQLYLKNLKDKTWIVRKKNGYECNTQSKEYYDKLKSKPSYNADVLCMFVATEGRVVSQFDEDKHTVDQLPINTEAPLYHVVDFNIGKLCSIQAQVVDDKLYISSDFFKRNSTSRDFMKELAYKFRDHKGGNILVPDHTFSHRSVAQDTLNNTNKTISMETKNPLTNNKFFDRIIVKQNNTDKDGATQLNDLFANNRIIISKSCNELISALNTLRWEVNSNFTKTEDDLEYDAYFDCIKYIAHRVMKNNNTSTGSNINIF